MISTPSDPARYRDQLRRALADDFLGDTLARFTRIFGQNRSRALEGLDFASLRDQVARVKDQALQGMMELFELFCRRARAGGAQVHLAATAAEANRIIAEIARGAGVKKIVKSKSMTAEETHLNHHLEALGLQVTETDLGEWIIQLRREGPSHMVAPAVHCSRQDVARLFSQVTGDDYDPDHIAGLVKVARRELRRAFLEADMGISGANLALAASGTVGIVTNEGNARLVTTLPRVHVALVGLEKLVPDLAAAAKILKLLPRNAAGQIISSYVTWIGGANQCAAGPGGKKEMHVVFLDNGRRALARDPVFAQALRCIRCGACANVCPIWRLVGGHNYGHVYIGAIGLILTYFYHGREKARALVRNCLNCQACKSVCPAGIDLPRLIKSTQALILGQEKPPAQNRLLRRVLADRRLFHFLLRRAYLAQRPLARGERLIRHLPRFFDPAHGFRSLPAIVKKPLRDRWPELPQPEVKIRTRVALFAGCLVDFVYPEQGEDLLKLTAGRGVKVDFPGEQTCCGLPALMAGEEETARRVARQNLRALDPAGYDQVLTLCASCASHIKHAYPRLLAGRPGLAVKARQLADKITDFSSFARDHLELVPPAPASRRPAAYHAPCHLCRGLEVRRPPRELIPLAGLEYLPLANEEVCCGFGGSYSLEFPEMSARILEEKLEAVEASGARLLLSDCPGCVLQLRGGLDQRGSALPVLHLVQALAQAQAKP